MTQANETELKAKIYDLLVENERAVKTLNDFGTAIAKLIDMDMSEDFTTESIINELTIKLDASSKTEA